MRQKTYHITGCSNEKISSVLTEIVASKEYRDAAQVLLLMLEQNWDQQATRERIGLVSAALPKAEIVGMTHFDRLLVEREPYNDVILTFLFFEREAFQIRYLDMRGRRDAEIGREIGLALRKQREAKALMTLFAKTGRDVESILRSAGDALEDIPVFGADAGSESFFFEDGAEGYVFDGRGCHQDALLYVIFHGENLSVEVSCNFGWIPVGKAMTVTAVKDPYTITEIDHRPAAELFERYLGIPYRENKLVTANICEFPLTVAQDGLVMGRIPYAWTSDGALRFRVPMKKGDQLRFSYGLPQQVFSQISEDAERFRAFEAQGILMVVCMNRMIFLREQERLETDAYRCVAPDAAFMHGNSEIFFKDGHGGELHSALVAVGFREGTASAAPTTHGEACQLAPALGKDQVIPLENRLMTFMRAATADLEQTTGELWHLKQNLEAEVKQKTRQVESLSLHVVQTLAEAIDAKDEYTRGHSGRVAAYAREIARRAGYTQAEQDDIYMMGLLHDVGKIGVPDAVITKPGRLTDEEFAQIKRHPALGARILNTIREMPKLVTGARWHHERYDGRGYPDGLSGADIPEEARIIGVADAYDAMTSNRSYRQSMSQSAVREQIEKGKGSQFDPYFADIMLQMIDEDVDFQMQEKV